MTLWTQSLGDILDNYADVIEGGNSHRGSGTAYLGVPGFDSTDRLIAEAGTITSEAGPSTTSIPYTNTLADAERAYRSDGPPFYLLGVTGENAGFARKISNWTTSAITVAAFGNTPAEGDTFVVREGFCRAPDNFDIEGEGGPDGGMDRSFSVQILPGAVLPYWGNGRKTMRGTLEVKLRLLKKSRHHQSRQSILMNLAAIRAVMTKPSSRDGTYTQVVAGTTQEPEILVDDLTKAVVSDRYEIVYRINTQES